MDPRQNRTEGSVFGPPEDLMKWRRHFTKKRMLVLAAVPVLYAGLWFLTDRIGSPQVRSVVVGDLDHAPGFTDVSDEKMRAAGPYYYCKTRTIAPFLVHVDYGRHRARLSGHGGSYLYFWFFGFTDCVGALSQWVE